MKLRRIAAAWAFTGLTATNAISVLGTEASARPTSRALAQGKIPEKPPLRSSGRLLLSPAQIAQALRSGTINRPVKSLLSVSSPLHYGDYIWDDKAIPSGPTWIRVDLRSQLISIFRSGHEIGSAVIVYGGDNKQTPLGTLHILAKSKIHRSSLYGAEMPYTLRLTGDGVSIHGSKVRWGAATHGCIGIPLGFARRLFDAARVGDDVVVVRSSRAS